MRFESTLRAAVAADLLVVVGTTGATILPALVSETAVRGGVTMAVVDPEPTPFTALAERRGRGLVPRSSACAVVPDLARRLAERPAAGASAFST